MSLRPCPNCSVVSTGYKESPIIWRLPRTGKWTLMACCALSRKAPLIDAKTSEDDAIEELTIWWEEQRASHPNKWALEQLDKEP